MDPELIIYGGYGADDNGSDGRVQRPRMTGLRLAMAIGMAVMGCSIAIVGRWQHRGPDAVLVFRGF